MQCKKAHLVTLVCLKRSQVTGFFSSLTFGLCFCFVCLLFFPAWIAKGFFVLEVELNHDVCVDCSLITFWRPTACLSRNYLILLLVHGNFRFVNFVFYLLGCFRDYSYSCNGAFLSLCIICSIIICIPLFFLCIHCDNLTIFLYISSSNCHCFYPCVL